MILDELLAKLESVKEEVGGGVRCRIHCGEWAPEELEPEWVDKVKDFAFLTEGCDDGGLVWYVMFDVGIPLTLEGTRWDKEES